MKIIATIKRSDGNDSVGDMWQETKSFDSSNPIKEVFDWYHKSVIGGRKEAGHFKTANIILSIDQRDV